MSYIRGIYNPEGLYIFQNIDGWVEIYEGPEYRGRIPYKLFDKLIDKYIEGGCEEAEVIDSFNGQHLKVTEVLDDDGVKKVLKYHGMDPIKMWDVTWEYIARSNYGRSKPFWRIRLVRKLFGPIV